MGFSSHLFLKVGTVGTRWDSKFVGKMVVGCFNTLGMGTSFAVEVAPAQSYNLVATRRVLDSNRTSQVQITTPARSSISAAMH